MAAGSTATTGRRRASGALLFLLVLSACCLPLFFAPRPAFAVVPDEVGPAQVAARRDRIGAQVDPFQRAHREAQRRASRRANRHLIDYEFSAARMALGAVGLALFAWGFWLKAAGDAGRRRLRLVLLCVAGALSYAAYYQFFVFTSVGGFASVDNFHYYVGSKYSSELGYYRLYECGLVALRERGLPAAAEEADALPADGAAGETGARPRARAGSRSSREPIRQARDLRSMRVVPAAAVEARGRDCPERFGPERWRSFADDVAWFARRVPPHIWRAAWADHGYHPSPVWNVVGRSLAALAPLDDPVASWVLPRIDRLLVALSLLCVAWAFGLEIAALAAIFWGTGFLWRYTWIGDAMLRQLWWSAALVGICFLRRGASAWGGAALGGATLLRLFPATLPLALLAGAARGWWRDRRRPPGLLQVVSGGAAVSALAFALVIATGAGGLTPFEDFAAKISRFSGMGATNKLGLAVSVPWVLVGLIESPPAALITAVRLGLLAGFGLLFWRALSDMRDWEAAALGALLIPFVTEPTNYYFGFLVLAIVLVEREARVGVWLLAANLAFSACGLFYYNEYMEFRVASLIALATCFAVAGELARRRRPPGESPAAEA